MEEEAYSWIRRTKFSHTICHRLDPAILASIHFSLEPDRVSGLKSRPGTISRPKSGSSATPLQHNPTTNKHRAVSPNFETKLSDTFKEARSDRKRFSTPHPQRKEPEKRVVGKLFHKDSHVSRASDSTSPPKANHYKHFSSMKFYDKMRSRKDSSWTKYFDHGGGKVTAVETADEWMVDLSQLFLGLRFAHGANSQLYHGIYKDEPVAVKIIRVPDDDENGALAARLEKQFNREVRLLSRLHHQNVIKVSH